MDIIKQIAGDTFASLSIRNYRLYFIGQGFSHIGNWMQTVGLGWLVLVLTGSGVQLGGVLAFRFLPMFLGPLFSGFVVDKFDKRKILYVTQSLFAFFALLLSVLVFANVAQIWMLYPIALCFGIIDAFDSPTRQTFVHEMVGPENLRNAVGLNSTEANMARTLGPMFAGALIATAGIAFCFLANAFSFFGLIIALYIMRPSEIHGERKTHGQSGIFAGLRYAWTVPVVRNVLLAMAVVGTFSYEFQTTLPLLARGTFAGNAADYAALLSAMGAGSVAGGLFAAGRKEVAAHEFVLSALFFGVSICAVALMPTLSLSIVAMIFVGFFSINLTSLGNTMVQLNSDSHMRGRVMSLWSMALFGSTLIGAPIVGWIGQHIDPRGGLLLGGIAAILASFWAASKMLSMDKLLAIPAFIRIREEEAEAAAEPKV